MSSGIRRQKKKYRRPAKLFEKERIEEENVFKERYGLKNKKEIWKAEAAIERLRGQAKKLITAPEEEQDFFIERLVSKGLLEKGAKIDSVLDMKKENLLNRRLQTIVCKKSLAKTPKHARQLITHRHVLVGERVVNIPSYSVDLKEEKKVRLRGG